MLLFPVYIKPEVTEATSKTATPSTLTFTSTRSSATVYLDSINAVSGSFATSTLEQTASFSISTNNATGYTLNIKTTGDDTALTDNTNSNTSTNHLNTISDISTADNFAVNSWGLIPSKYNGSTNTTNYYPASSTGFTMDETNTANSTANNYTVGIGIKVNYDMKSATYSNDTLIAEYVANPVTYSISYYSNTSDTVDDMPLTNPQTGTISDPTTSTGDIITTLASAPTRDGYTFLGWCAGNSVGTADTTNDTSITNIITTDDADTCSSTVYDADQSFGINATGSSPDAYYLYAMWTPAAPDLPCEAGYICYRGNGATAGTMPDQEVTSSTVMLTSSNFSRPGYGFAGWNTSSDGTGTNYGPAETITPGDLSSEGLKLYARWLAPSGVLQTWAGASNMNVGDVIALRDNRDNEVYTVAKLADNNVWITENLRLVPNTANITDKNTHNPTSTFLSAIPSSSSSTTQCSTDDSTCNDHVYFYTGNMDRTKTQSPINNSYDYAWYSYGAMYNWYTATAGNGTNSKTSGSVSGDICPSGWHLPTGGSSGEYAALSSALGGNSSTGATNIRKYPNNFIWSGDYNPGTQIPDGRGTQARIWSSTAQSAAKSYRMGFNSSSITPAGTWNKWDNFAVRCIYQGGNLPYSAVTVDFEGTGINSLTFTNPSYDTETATPTSPTISIVEGAEYTVTANLTTGYEVSSWSTTTNGILGNTTTTNPAVNPNTYTITGDATLTVTGQITPTYDVTVTLGEHITGISFSHPTYGTINITPQNSTDNGDGTYTNTTTLYRGVEYTLSSSYEDGYTIHEWVAGANSTIGSTTSAATNYSITGNSTLSITAEETDELTYTLVYSAGQGTDAPDSETETVYTNTHEFTITNSAPIYYGYTFTGWSETADANGNGATVDYTSGDTITVASTGATTTKTLYPVYQAVSSCPSGKICYYENGADVLGGGRGTMANQSASSNSTANLIPTNYSKSGYGFAGWTTDSSATPYGPNATITTPDLSSTGLALYAKWVKSTGTLQAWNSCNSLNTNDVTALTDSRDNETYAVAKLADDNCWIIENLRLVPSTANITNQNTHNPASGFATEAASSSSSNALCTTDDSSTCINQLQYNTNSLNRSLTQSYNAVSNSAGWYSYGVYYNWYTATAGNGTMETEANTNATGDICPSKWHLPTSTSSGEWASLNTAVNGGVSNADAGLRQYPVNLIWSGDYNGSSRTSGYGNGRYWAATGYDTNNAYRMGHQESGSKGSTPSGNFKKWDGFAVRCIYDGEAIVYSDVVVALPQNVTSITFTNNKYGTETATTNNNTVSLVQGATYTITAEIAAGYEFITWTNGQNSAIGSTSANPTTVSITDDTTLALTVQEIPSYQVTVNLDAHTTGMSFVNASYPAINVVNNNGNGDGTETTAVSLKRGVAYTITGAYDSTNHYFFNNWATTGNGTIGSTTAETTTFTVNGAATLSLTSRVATSATLSTHSFSNNNTCGEYRTIHSLTQDISELDSYTISTYNSEYPIYLYEDMNNDICYIYTEADIIALQEDASGLFGGGHITNIDFASDWDTSNVTDMSSMFSSADYLTNIDGAINWDTSSVTDMSHMFECAYSLTNIDGAINWNTSSVTTMYGMFNSAYSLTNIDGAINWDTRSVTDMREMFRYTSSLTDIDGAINWDTSSVTNMKEMFSFAPSLTNIDGAINWNTSSVTDMQKMFFSSDPEHSSLTNIDGAINWDTRSVTDMREMFQYKSSLTNIDGAINWNTGNVTDMTSMFYEASSLTNIDSAINWDTSSVTGMGWMFGEASLITNIDALSNWDTGNVTDMRQMFRGASALTDTSGANNWDIRSVYSLSNNAGTQYGGNNFYHMFSHAGNSDTSDYHPTFTNRSGTWDNNGTFIPGDNTTTATVTIAFDSHISGIELYGFFPGSNSLTSQIISTSGSTVSLTRGERYRITATLASGYELSLWDPGEHGVVPSNRLARNTGSSGVPGSDSDYTYFTPTGDTTLTATSQPIPNDITTTINMDSNIKNVSFCNNKYNTFSPNTGFYNCIHASTNGGTITLKQGVTYRVTAATKSGYEVSSYTAAGATVTNTMGSHTDFTPSGTSTLNIVSTTAAATHTVTVNMDSNISYVTFESPDWPNKVAAQNGSTVDLRQGTSYTVTAYLKNGSEFVSWALNNSSYGALSSTSANPTTFTPNANSASASLTITGQEKPKVYIQDLTPTACQVNVGTNGNAANVGDEITVYDKRDGSDYTVRYINGECWMTQNLRYLGDTGSAAGTMTIGNSNSNVANKSITLYSLDYSNAGSFGAYSSHCDSTNGYNNACVYDSGSTSTGVWYNYYAATAGTVSTTFNDTLASQNICPKNWHLPSGPTTTSTTDFNKLVGTTGSGWQNATDGFTAFGAVAGGYYNDGLLGNTGYGRWWSSIPSDPMGCVCLGYNSSNGQFSGMSSNSRYYGRFVRCVRSS